MNYLAHTYLSFSEEQIVGNLLEDFVRNSQRLPYPQEIQKGITLHRRIDTFTDAHPIIHKAKKIFSPYVRLYSGIFVDIAMDYFLANDENIMSEKEWQNFTLSIYKTLEKYNIWLPERLKNALPSMKKDNWLYNYRYHSGIKSAMIHITKKAQYLSENTEVFEVFLNHKEELKHYYTLFFPELKEYCNEIIKEI